MNVTIHETGTTRIAEIKGDSILINDAEEGLQLLVDVYYQDIDKMILYEQNISPLFFDLSSRLAGEILQKFSNFKMRLVIIGEFKKYENKSLRDFIFESNAGRQINFLPSLVEAIDKLAK